jgi:hypothetical protein
MKRTPPTVGQLPSVVSDGRDGARTGSDVVTDPDMERARPRDGAL